MSYEKQDRPAAAPSVAFSKFTCRRQL